MSPWLRMPIIILASLVAILFAGLAVTAGLARLADGPIAIFPGGPLRAGVMLDYDAVDWSALSHVREIEFQLETPPVSRTTWFMVSRGTPYIPCSFCTNTLLKRWPRQLGEDNRVVIRIDGKLVQGRATRVPHASAEFLEVVAVGDSKYGGSAAAADRAEYSAARAVTAAIEMSESLTSTQDEDESTDRWLFRIDRR